MIAALILFMSLAAMMEFFVMYCRSLLASSSDHILSEEVRCVAGIAGNRVAADQFAPLMSLVKMCPVLQAGARNVYAVRIYFRVMTLAARCAQRLGLDLANRLEGERIACAFFAAVALDRRITDMREILLQQMSNN